MCDWNYNEDGKMICSTSGKEIKNFEKGYYCDDCCVTYSVVTQGNDFFLSDDMSDDDGGRYEKTEKDSNVDRLISRVNLYADISSRNRT